jgi:competence protein ComEC
MTPPLDTANQPGATVPSGATGRVERLVELVRSRPWHVAVAGLAAGLALSTSQRPGLTIGVALVFLCVPAVCRAPAVGALSAALVLVGAAVGAARLQAIDAPAGRVHDGETVKLRAHLVTRPRASPFGSSAEVRVASGELSGARLLMRVARWTSFPARLPIGAELVLEGRLRTIPPAGGTGSGPGAASGTGPGSGDSDSSAAGDTRFDFGAYLRRRGIAGELLLDSARATGAGRGGLVGALDRMQARAERAVAAGLPPPDAALARGMVLGQDEAIAESVREDFRESGLAHLLAVSGQNVMLLVALALPLLAAAGLGPRGRGMALLVLVAFYVPLAGGGPSLQRAGVMGAAGIAAMTMSRPSSRWYALLLAAAVTLALNPRAWLDPGWQLSFAAVAGILLIGVPLGRVLTRAADNLIPAAGETRAATEKGPLRWAPAGRAPARALARGLAEGVAITVAAGVATAPLLAHHFGTVSLAALPANLLALPAVAPAMWLGMVKAALGVLAPVLPGAGRLAAAAGPPTRVPIAYLGWLAERFADVPGGLVGLPSFSPRAAGVAYAAIGAAALGLRELVRRYMQNGEELAGRWRRLGRGGRVAAASLVLTVLAFAAVCLLAPPGPPADLTVRFLDVGQGDATLIQHPDGTAVLFDGGPPEAGVERLLRKAGVRRLALVVATHMSRDHQGGLPAVLERYPVDLLLDGGDGTTDAGFRAVLAAARSHHVRTVPALAPLALRAGPLGVRILSPAPRAPGPAPEDPNPRAVVAIVSCDGFDLLLSADAESEALLPLDLPDVDAMKVPHHGSADPGLPAVLDRLRPELAAIEVGTNTYGHPTPSTLRALSRAHVPTYRTDRDGTVSLAVAGGELRVETER